MNRKLQNLCCRFKTWSFSYQFVKIHLEKCCFSNLTHWFIPSPLVLCGSAPPFYVLCCKTCYSLQYWGSGFYSLTGELASDQNHSTTSCCPFFQAIRFTWYLNVDTINTAWRDVENGALHQKVSFLPDFVLVCQIYKGIKTTGGCCADGNGIFPRAEHWQYCVFQFVRQRFQRLCLAAWVKMDENLISCSKTIIINKKRLGFCPSLLFCHLDVCDDARWCKRKKLLKTDVQVQWRATASGDDASCILCKLGFTQASLKRQRSRNVTHNFLSKKQKKTTHHCYLTTSASPFLKHSPYWHSSTVLFRFPSTDETLILLWHFWLVLQAG